MAKELAVMLPAVDLLLLLFSVFKLLLYGQLVARTSNFFFFWVNCILIFYNLAKLHVRLSNFNIKLLIYSVFALNLQLRSCKLPLHI